MHVHVSAYLKNLSMFITVAVLSGLLRFPRRAGVFQCTVVCEWKSDHDCGRLVALTSIALTPPSVVGTTSDLHAVGESTEGSRMPLDFHFSLMTL